MIVRWIDHNPYLYFNAEISWQYGLKLAFIDSLLLEVLGYQLTKSKVLVPPLPVPPQPKNSAYMKRDEDGEA